MMSFTSGFPKERLTHVFIDGSHFLKEIEKNKKQNTNKLNLISFFEKMQFALMHETSKFVRVSLYFKRDESRVFTQRSRFFTDSSYDEKNRDHYMFIQCGHTNQETKASHRCEACHSSVNCEYTEHKEKGVDLRIAADALMLAGIGGIRKFVLLTNDEDFIPLFEALQKLGASTYLACIAQNRNKFLSDAVEKVFDVREVFLSSME